MPRRWGGRHGVARTRHQRCWGGGVGGGGGGAGWGGGGGGGGGVFPYVVVGVVGEKVVESPPRFHHFLVSLSGEVTHGDLCGGGSTVAHVCHGRGCATGERTNLSRQIGGAGDRVAVELCDDVANLEPCLLSGTARGHRLNKCADNV